MYYDNNTIIYFNGEFVKAAEAKIDLYSQSLHYGYAVFEGIRSYPLGTGTRIFKAKDHFNRLIRSAEIVQMPINYSAVKMIELSYEVLRRNNLSNAYLRPLVFCSPNMGLTKAKETYLTIQAWDWSSYFVSKRLKLMTSTYSRPNPTAFHMEAKVSGHYVNSILASQQAQDNGFDEALLLDVNEFVAEGPGANVFFEKNGMLYTPPKGNILPGITRSTVIEICYELNIPVVEKLFRPAEMKGVDAAFYCGTAAEVVAIESLDHVPFRLAWEDSLSQVIQKAYKKLVLGKSFAELRSEASRLSRQESTNIEPAHRVQQRISINDQIFRSSNFQISK
jgi:branched-chain amino acid aminotransferase